MRFDLAVLIGCFQPFHLGHVNAVHAGLKQARNVLLLCGSGNRSRSVRNPWTVAEREDMIRASLPETVRGLVLMQGVDDDPCNEAAWIRNVRDAVQSVTNTLPSPVAVALITPARASDWRRYFPEWEKIEIYHEADGSGAAIRAELFGATGSELWKQDVPPEAASYIEHFRTTATFRNLKAEQTFLTDFSKSWESAPYPPVFVTVDAVVECSGHILLVERGGLPGKGLLALPGGFLEQKETLLASTLRELREETLLDVSADDLAASLKESAVFDDPYRSTRGRTITHAFHFRLERNALPPVAGGDDAARAIWVPFGHVTAETMFEDHYFIIKRFLDF